MSKQNSKMADIGHIEFRENAINRWIVDRFWWNFVNWRILVVPSCVLIQRRGPLTMLGVRAQIDLWRTFLLVIQPTSSKIIREHSSEDSAARLHKEPTTPWPYLPNAVPELVVHSGETHAYIMALWGTPQGITLNVKVCATLTNLSDTYFSLIKQRAYSICVY